MFTRIPTFIPSEGLEAVNEQPIPRKEAKKSSYGVGQARRKRTKAIRKRVGVKKPDDDHCEELPVISGRDSRTHKLQTPTRFSKLRSSKLFESRTPAPYSPPFQREEVNSELSRRVRKTSEHSNPKTAGAVSSIGKGLSDEREMFTYPTVHTRSRRKLTDDAHDTRVKKQAKQWPYNQEEATRMDTSSKILEYSPLSKGEGASSGESRTPSLIENQLPFKGPRQNPHESDVSKSFKSKIPVRFPEIQENKGFQESRVKYSPNKQSTTLPPIVNPNCSKGSPDQPGHVTKATLYDYQNIVEQDFKRLGENLENTFRLLQQYIKCNTNTNTLA